MSLVKHRRDIASLRTAAHAAASICEELTTLVTPDNNAGQLETQANKLLARYKSTAPFKIFQDEAGQRFGYACCVSVNNEVVNGLPLESKIFQPGDVVSVAIGTCVGGIHGKAARTVVCGQPNTETPLIMASRQLFVELAEETFQPKTVGELCRKIADIAQNHGVYAIPDTAGHGIGKQHQQGASLPNVVPNDLASQFDSIPLVSYQAFVPMPMLAQLEDTTATHPSTKTADDGWTLTLAQPGLASHWANTCWINADGVIEVSSV